MISTQIYRITFSLASRIQQTYEQIKGQSYNIHFRSQKNYLFSSR